MNINNQVDFFMQSLLLQCKVYNTIRRFEDAINKGLPGLDLAQNHGNEQIEMEVSLELWRAYHSSGQQHQAGVYKGKCIRFIKTLAERYPDLTDVLLVSGKDNERSIQMKLHLGILQNAVSSGRQLEQALWHGKKCIAIAEQSDTKLVEFNACLLLSEVYTLLKWHHEAMLYTQRCIEINQLISNKEEEQRHLFIGETYVTAKENSQLLDFPREIIESLLLQCKDFNRLQKYTDAIESGVKCMERALGNTQVEIEAALELWRAFRLLHQDDSAGAFYKEKCIEFVSQCVTENPQLEQYGCLISEDDSAAQVDMKVHFAIMQNAFHKKSRMEQAVWHGKKSIEIAQEIDDKPSEMNAYWLLAKTYFTLAQYDKANYCCRRWSKINQSAAYSRTEITVDCSHYALIDQKVCIESQEENWSACCPDSLRISESTRKKTKYLILQCKGYNRLKKYPTAIETGKKCIEIADQFNHPDKDLIKMEAALELCRAYRLLQQDDNALMYQRQYNVFAQHYANSLLQQDKGNKINSITSERGSNECQYKKWNALCTALLRLPESRRQKAKHLILQCRGYNRLRKYAKAIEKGKKCIEISDQLSQLNLIKMETALELWRAYQNLEQINDAMLYQKKYIGFVQQYSYSLPADDPDKKEWTRLVNRYLCYHTNLVIASFFVKKAKSNQCIKRNDFTAAILHNVRAAECIKGKSNDLFLRTFRDLVDLHGALNQYYEALDCIERIIEVAKAFNYKKWEFECYLMKAEIYRLSGGEDSCFLFTNEALRISKETNNIKSSDLASFYLERHKALMFSKKNDINSAILHNKNAVEMFKLRKNKYPLLSALEDLADLLLKLDRHLEAIEQAEKIIEVARSVGNMEWEFRGYQIKGEIYALCMSKYDSSLTAFNEALRIAKENNDNINAGLASFWIERVRGLDCSQKGDTKVAIVHYKKAIEMFNGEDKYTLIVTLNELTDLHCEFDQYSEAITCTQKIIELSRDINYERGELHGNLMKGLAYIDLGDYDSSLPAFKEVLRISEKNNDNEIANIASFWMGRIRGWQCLKKYDIKAATSHLEKAVKCIKDNNTCKDWLLEASHGLFHCYCELSRYSEALQVAEFCLKAARDDLSNKEWESKSYLIKGHVYIQLGDHPSALSALGEALKISDKYEACDSDIAEIYLHQAVCYLFLGDVEAATKCFSGYIEYGLHDIEDGEIAADIETMENALDLDPSTLDPIFFNYYKRLMTAVLKKQPILLALYSFTLLKFILKFEDHLPMSEIKDSYQSPEMSRLVRLLNMKSINQLVDIQKDMILKEQGQEVQILPQATTGGIYCTFSIICYLLGNFEMCKKILKLSLATLEYTTKRLAVEHHKITLIEQYVDTYKFLFKVLVKMGRDDEALWVAESCRAKELKFRLLCRDIEQGDIKYSNVTSYVLERKCAIIFYIWCFEDLFIYSIQRAKDDNGKDIPVIKMHCKKNCKTQLDHLINVTRGGMMPAITRAVNSEAEDYCCSTAMSGSQSEIDIHNCKDAHPDRNSKENTVDNKVNKKDFCCPMARAGPPSENDNCNFNGTRSEEDFKERPYEELYEFLIQPVGDIDGDELAIICEGILYKLPFPSLQNPTTKHYLSQDAKLRFSPCMTTLVTQQIVPNDYYARSGSLIIGNPSVDGIEGLEPLPGSQKEAETIAQIIGGVMPLTGRRATKSAVLERLCEVCIAHFACHIKLNPSAIVLSHEGSLQDDDDSYRLKPEDIMEKDVHARLVVLSGCNSGLGKICAEGVVGIARAFLAAGAAAVLVSLWRIDDHSTCEFMTIFYTYFLDWNVRRGASESLYLTINTMRTRYPNEPEKWSGFYLMGDDVTIVRESLSVLPEPELPKQPVSSGREPCENTE